MDQASENGSPGDPPGSAPGSAAGGISSRGLATRTITGAMWTSGAAVAELVLHAIIVAILARLLSPAEFGIYAVAMIAIGLNRVFAEGGLGPSLVQRKTLKRAHITTAFTATLILCGVCSLLIIGLAPVFAWVFRNDALAPVIWALSILFLVRGFGVVAYSLLKREMRFPEIAKAEFVSYALAYGLVGIGMALAGAGYWALVCAHLLQTSLQTVQFLKLQPHAKELGIDRHAFRELFSFGAGVSIGRFGNYLALKGDNLVVGRVLGVEALGFYSRAFDLMSVPVGLYQTVATKVLFSAVAKVQDERERLARAHRRAAAVTALMLIPPSLLGFALAPEIVRTLLGPGWDSVIVPFQIIALGMFFRSGYNVGAAVARGTGDVHRLALRQWIYAAMVVTGAWAGHPFGLAGSAIGVTAAILAHFTMVSGLSLRASSLSWKEFGGAHLPALLVGGLVWSSATASGTVLRSAGSPPVVTLMLSTASAMLVVVLLVRAAPSIMLGRDGIWTLQMILRNLPVGPLRSVASMLAPIARPAARMKLALADRSSVPCHHTDAVPIVSSDQVDGGAAGGDAEVISPQDGSSKPSISAPRASVG